MIYAFTFVAGFVIGVLCLLAIDNFVAGWKDVGPQKRIAERANEYKRQYYAEYGNWRS